jgi:kynureninase
MENSYQYARQQDAQDILASFRQQFHIPLHEGKPCVYLCGNSLGLQPKTAAQALSNELQKWANLGVEAHFKGENPWLSYHKNLTPTTAKLVGAKPHEVVVMNNLTVNLHLLLVSFYQPTPTRYKILMEGGAFPSDQYAAESQVKFHGFTPEDAIVEIFPRKGEYTLRTADIEAKIAELGSSLALVLFGGVNYYTGQVFAMQSLTQKGHEVGAKVGFDLAHATGNVLLQLHKWEVDFAVWCTYKYLNSGAGGTSGVFVHEKYAQDPTLPRFAGWWGHNEQERFLMKKGFQPSYGAAGWQLSNAQILPMAVHKASLDIFEEAGMENLRAKSEKLTAFAAFLIDNFNQEQDNISIQVLTPNETAERGCQLSLVVDKNGKQVHEKLAQAGVIADWREPDVIRIAPVPLYNSFEDVWRFYKALKDCVA